MIYTFKQPVRGGYYYIVVEAESNEEAAHITTELAESFECKTEQLQFLSKYPDYSGGTLTLTPTMQRRLNELGYAHKFVPVYATPYHERVGHRGFLPD